MSQDEKEARETCAYSSLDGKQKRLYTKLYEKYRNCQKVLDEILGNDWFEEDGVTPKGNKKNKKKLRLPKRK